MSDRTQFIIGLFVLIGAIALGVYQWNEREALLLQAQTLNAEGLNLTAISETLANKYDEVKVTVTKSRESSLQEITMVFPTEENLTNLTRLFDDFSVTNNYAENPFFINSLSYESPKNSEDGQYRYLPIQISIVSSKKNFNEFLEFVNTSGSLEGQVRLMSIEDIRVAYPAEYGGSYEIQMDLHAYFSKEL